jgi:phage terminase large subunit
LIPQERAERMLDLLPLAAVAVKLRKSRPHLVPTFRGAALEAQTITAHEWITAGPAETGKTFADLHRLDALMRETPRATAVIVRKVRSDMNATVLQTWRRIIAIRGGVEVYGGEEAKFYTYPNGSRVYVCGMDRPGAALSSERDYIFVNQAEELALEDWETLTTRCTGRGCVAAHPMIFGDCNPGPNTHWIINRPSLRVLQSTHRDNPTLYGEDGTITEQGVRTMAVLENLTGVRKARLLEGKWVAAEGVVYDFQRAIHLVAHFDPPSDWRRIRSIDLGYTNPFVCQWWAISPDDDAYLYRELYMTGRLAEDHARQIVQLTGEERIEATVADHDAEDRATLARYGVETMPAYKAVTVGIQAVAARLAATKNGKPRLYVMEGVLVERDEALANAKKPTCTLDEFENYAWPKGADGKIVKEEPVKVYDHGMDACRYAVAYLDNIADADNAGWLALAARMKEPTA